MINRVITFIAAVLLAGAAEVRAQETPQAFVGARIIPIEAEEIADGLLVVQNGKIVYVGVNDPAQIPAGAERHDAAGSIIMPGLICTHSHVGGVGGGDSSAPLQPSVRIFDSINVRDSGFMRARAGGLTTLNIMPGSGHLMSGQTVYVKLRDADTMEDMFIMLEGDRIAGGMKMANGTNPQRDPPFPGTRGKAAALVRETFVEAQDYRRKIEAAAGDESKAPARDLGMEALLEVLDGTRVVHHHTHRHDDIVTVLRLADEFGFRVVLHHVSEAWKVADQIAEAGAPCSVILVDSPGGKLEAIDLVWETGTVLDEAGVLVGFHTDDWITDSRVFFRMAALGVRAGMDRDKALEALTIAGAKMLDLDDRTGSLAAGKDADFVVLSGDPFSVYTHVEQTWVEGVQVFDRSNPEHRLYAEGGYGAGHDQDPYFCCFDHHGRVN